MTEAKNGSNHSSHTTAPAVVAIIQARMSSSRLPGKVLLDIAGQPMLAHVVDRARRAQTVHQVVVATTADPSDDPVVGLCQQIGAPVVRGSQHDVLDRYYRTAQVHAADVIVRLTADCPLLDPDLIDYTVRAFFGQVHSPAFESWPATPPINPLAEAKDRSLPYDFAANRLPPPWGRTYPIGLDVEVCTFNALARAWREAKQSYQREHVMPYLYDTPGRFNVLLVNHPQDYGHLRWTVDTPADLAFVRQVFAYFSDQPSGWQQILALLERHPELAAINAGVHHKNVHDVDDRRP